MKDAREILHDVIRDNPRGSTREWSETTWARLQGNEKHLRAIFEYWFANTVATFKVEVTASTQAILRQTRTRAKSAPPSPSETQRAKEHIKAVLMDHLLSNGKLLRSATFADCKAEGGWISALSRCGKATQVVGKKLTEKDVANVRRRFIGG